MKRSNAVAFGENATTVLLAVAEHMPHIPATVPVAARLRNLTRHLRANAPKWPALIGHTNCTCTYPHHQPLMFGDCAPVEHIPSIRWLAAAAEWSSIYVAIHTFAKRGANDVLILMQRAFPNLYCWPFVGTTAAYADNWTTVLLLIDLGIALENEICVVAADRGRLDMLQLLLQADGMMYTPAITQAAAGNGHIHVLEWLTTLEYPRLSSAFFKAVRNGLLHVVDWLLQHDFPVTSGAYKYAIITIGDENDVVMMLEELHKRGFPLDNVTCSLAIIHGSIAALKWLRKQGCPCDKDTSTLAAQLGCVEMLEWLVANGCPWDMENIIENATIYGNARLFALALNHGWHVTDNIIERLESAGYIGVGQGLRRNKPPQHA